MTTAIAALEVPQIDPSLSDHAAQQAQLAELAAQSWIARGQIGYTLLHYEDCVAILRDKRWHSATSRIPEMMGITDERLTSRRRVSILAAEGDVHTRLRRLVAPAFNPRAADALRPFMREVMNSLIDPVAAVGGCELVAQVCDPYPIPIICELLGAPKSDWQLFSRLAADVLRIFNGTLADELDILIAAQEELDEYTRDLIAARRNQPADDLITSLIAAEEQGDRLSEDELVMMVEAVIVGGTDTTRNQLGCTVALMTQHPEQWQMLADDPSLAPQAVEESMRYFGAVRATGRFASVDIEYKGVLFPAGTLVMPALAIANRDASVFSDADRFDIGRRASTQPQLTFGSGIHYCLGAALARAEQQEALPLLARRMPNLRLDGDIVWKPTTVGIFGPDRLPLRFDPN